MPNATKAMVASLRLMLLLALAGAAAAETVPAPEGYTPPLQPRDQVLDGLIVTLDPGHGGHPADARHTRGTSGVATGQSEANLNMRTAALLLHHLQDSGARVYLTRRDDRSVLESPVDREAELKARGFLADYSRSHLFLSVNHLGASAPDAHGVVIMYWPTDSAGNEQLLEHKLADIARDEIREVVKMGTLFHHWHEPHPLATSTDVPALIIEYGFLTNPEFDAWAARPTAPRDEALATYNAVVRMWTEHREALEAERLRLFPELSSAAPPADEPPHDAFPLGTPARNLWPLDRPIESSNEATFFIGAFRRFRLSDHTTFRLEAAVGQRPGGGWVLTGTTNSKTVGKALHAELTKALGSEPENQLRLLPDETLGADPFGVVRVPMAMTWASPEEGVGVQTQLLLGEPLFLLDQSHDKRYLLVQGIDGYLGWVRADAVERLDRPAFTRLMAAPMARVAAPVTTNERIIPTGAAVTVADDGSLALSDGTTEDGGLVPVHHPANPSLGRRAAEAAMALLYTPYVFGGRSPLGLDCSGLVGVAWAAVGIQLPRDANQQATMGRLVATPYYLDGLRPGDALFFIDHTGRVIHTGLSLGGMRFIHAAPPEVQINSLDPDDPLYSATWHRAFALGRRPAE